MNTRQRLDIKNIIQVEELDNLMLIASTDVIGMPSANLKKRTIFTRMGRRHDIFSRSIDYVI